MRRNLSCTKEAALDQNGLITLMVSGSAALAGLILVFLGTVLTAYDGYSAEGRSSVRKKYRRRAWVALLGFLAALVSIALALAGNWICPKYFVPASVVFFSLSLVLVLLAAVEAVTDIS